VFLNPDDTYTLHKFSLDLLSKLLLMLTWHRIINL